LHDQAPARKEASLTEHLVGATRPTTEVSERLEDLWRERKMRQTKWFLLTAMIATIAMLPLSAQAADIGLTKDVSPHSPNIYHAGDTIHYVMSIQNITTVGETIRVDTVTDLLPDGTLISLDNFYNASFPSLPYELAPGDVENYAIDWVIPMGTSGTVTNDLGCTGVQYSTVDDPFDAHVVKTSLIISPCVEISKEVDCDISKAGDEVLYHICIHNCSGENTPIEILSVVDDVIGDIAGYFPSSLSTDEEFCADVPYIIAGDDPDPLENTVTVMAEDESGYAVSDFASEEVDLIHPSIEVSMDCLTDPVSPGGDADFDVRIDNTGDCDLIVTTDLPEAMGPMTISAGDYYETTVTRTDPGGVDCVPGDFTATWTLPTEYCELDNTGTAYAEACCPIEGGEEGCTPGFWKNHHDCWCDAYAPEDRVDSVFTIPSEISELAGDTLDDALKYKGGNEVIGAARNLLRSSVSALLNACSSDINYPLNVSAVINDVNSALATLDRNEILSLHGMLDTYNNYGCPIDAHCNPMNYEDESFK
jgi:hypothetical protein